MSSWIAWMQCSGQRRRTRALVALEGQRTWQNSSPPCYLTVLDGSAGNPSPLMADT
jgi:hypothetical protein